jgi:uncharacterized membrane protein
VIRRSLLVVAALVAFVVPVAIGFAPDANALPCGQAHDATSTDATVNPDGSMDVVETLTFDFDDGCHGGIRTIDLTRVGAFDTLGASNYSVGPISVTENGEPSPIADSGPGFVKWGDADVEISGGHVYELRYHIDHAILTAADVGVLYWQFIGNGSPHQKSVDVTIHMPGDGTGLRAFPHGALNGVATLEGSDVHLHVDDNPANTPVEVRVLEPATNFTTVAESLPIENDILAAEKIQVDKANARRAELRQELKDEENRKKVGNIGSPIAALLAIVAFGAIFLKWGKEPPKPDDIGDYYRDIPEDPPAVCQAVRSFGDVSNDAFSATLIDLAQRGWLTISEEHSDGGFLHRDKTDYRFTRTPKNDGTLTDYESKLLWRLFPNGGSITQSELVADAKSTPTASAKWMDTFKKSIRDDVKRRGYIDTTHLWKWVLHFLTIVVLGGIGALALSQSAWLGLIPIGVAVGLFLASPLLRKRTEKGARKEAEVEGLRRFLNDFSRLPDEAHAGDLVLYERYLVYAVALGVATQLIEGLRVRFPQLADPNSGFATWYVAGSMGNGLSGMGRLDSIGNIGSFASEFSSATAAAFSPPSSSSGSGGGFSGGGGGGGGGGGSGGW